MDQFEKDTKALGTALFILMIAGSLLAVFITVLLLESGYSEGDSAIIANALGLVAVETFILQHYSKKLTYELPLHMPKATLSIPSYLNYTIAALGVFWGSALMINLLSLFVSDYISFSTPDFTPDGSLIGNIFNVGYGILLAPIMEELLCRGLLLGKLKEYGRVFAIVTVSVVFALLHGNLPQAIPAFCLSIVVCCMTLKAESILPAISVHMLANLIGYASMSFSGDLFQLIMNVLNYLVIIAGIILVILYLRKTPLCRLKDEPHRVMEFFGSWGSMTFLIISILGMILTFSIQL